MEITRIQNVYTVVRNMQESREFYRTALGLSVKFEDRLEWCQFGVGGSNFALSSIAEGPLNSRGSVVVFEAPSLEGIESRVRAAGGTLMASRSMGAHGSVMTFADPEKNLFQVFAKSSQA
ncbi:hypothetical protein SAMN05518854_101858 [Variovorax sp. YR266]|uniref:VOC family protein n=1 Tax=Variovorax sp. YR266 TaxID=1884386 RepID=UPI0008942248|nr:VOC family protein [Variovorax sp. YR266]SDY35115.1 hypothetical protein SAMN05518854_101858 [Variovorax sp. YR266]